jgi:hypothetical protein
LSYCSDLRYKKKERVVFPGPGMTKYKRKLSKKTTSKEILTTLKKETNLFDKL